MPGPKTKNSFEQGKARRLLPTGPDRAVIPSDLSRDSQQDVRQRCRWGRHGRRPCRASGSCWLWSNDGTPLGCRTAPPRCRRISGRRKARPWAAGRFRADTFRPARRRPAAVPDNEFARSPAGSRIRRGFGKNRVRRRGSKRPLPRSWMFSPVHPDRNSAAAHGLIQVLSTKSRVPA